ncbi:uncharacterized protein RHO25_007889 [Cercospora beticola]|uniref:Uncharacterized protein n=1 Tax=Cercospora beticola TaxID=122368 RepID=A0ABZ0NUG5_CERBT|nr:hypothetical protein RHO25_007889 [Cercospora beticola]CAK1358029.1 unnamed protein product [Cercospora beticola]
MPSGEWYINGAYVPTHLVARRDPDYVPFQSLHGDWGYPQGTNYPQYDMWPPEDYASPWAQQWPGDSWTFWNGEMYPMDRHQWFWRFDTDGSWIPGRVGNPTGYFRPELRRWQHDRR